MAPILDSMPVVLDASQLDAWIEPKAAEVSLRSMLRPAPDGCLVAGRASPLVNRVNNDGPELLAGLLD
jgi:putative SOS response-associated peptidase YedK